MIRRPRRSTLFPYTTLSRSADAPLLGREREIRAARDLAVDADLAAAHGLQARHGTQQRGLAAARGADEHADVASGQIQRDALHGGPVAARVAHLELGDGQKHAAIVEPRK